MASSVGRISQETFDQAVRENVEEFGESVEEAFASAVAEFRRQGADLSLVITTPQGKAAGEDITREAARLHDLLKADTLDAPALAACLQSLQGLAVDEQAMLCACKEGVPGASAFLLTRSTLPSLLCDALTTLGALLHAPVCERALTREGAGALLATLVPPTQDQAVVLAGLECVLKVGGRAERGTGHQGCSPPNPHTGHAQERTRQGCAPSAWGGRHHEDHASALGR